MIGMVFLTNRYIELPDPAADKWGGFLDSRFVHIVDLCAFVISDANFNRS